MVYWFPNFQAVLLVHVVVSSGPLLGTQRAYSFFSLIFQTVASFATRIVLRSKKKVAEVAPVVWGYELRGSDPENPTERGYPTIASNPNPNPNPTHHLTQLVSCP